MVSGDKLGSGDRKKPGAKLSQRGIRNFIELGRGNSPNDGRSFGFNYGVVPAFDNEDYPEGILTHDYGVGDHGTGRFSSAVTIYSEMTRGDSLGSLVYYGAIQAPDTPTGFTLHATVYNFKRDGTIMKKTGDVLPEQDPESQVDQTTPEDTDEVPDPYSRLSPEIPEEFVESDEAARVEQGLDLLLQYSNDTIDPNQVQIVVPY